MRSLLFKILLVCILLIPVTANAETENILGEMPSLPGEDLYNSTVEQIISGELSLNPATILNILSDNLLGEIRECAQDVMILFIIAAISGVITAISASFGNKSIGEAAFFACFTLMSAAALQCFTIAMEYGRDVTSAMTDFITKLSPLLMLMIATSGYAASAAAFQPVMSGAVYVVSIVIDKCLMPLIVFSAILSVAGNVSDRVQLSGFCKVVKSTSKWIMAAITTVFTGISAVYGFSTPALDAVSAKAIKFAIGSLVPVVGSFLSDTLETVVSGTKLIKNSVGSAGIIVMCVICLIPILKISAIQLMLKLTSAIAEPLTDKRISSMMWEMSESVTAIFGVIVMVAVLFMINISIMLAATGGG
ncbi:MAG: stage III sporulation protein AE [Oscillospiraceae bacterium]|nr:stage III sporulation protein AE [Oscillospiraceae bacterium]